MTTRGRRGGAFLSAMPHFRALAVAAPLALGACTDEGEGSVTTTGTGIILPWWVMLAVVLLTTLAWLELRRRR